MGEVQSHRLPAGSPDWMTVWLMMCGRYDGGITGWISGSTHSLTEAENAAARAFRASQRAALKEKNTSEPPDITVSVFIQHYRHDCAAAAASRSAWSCVSITCPA